MAGCGLACIAGCGRAGKPGGEHMEEPGEVRANGEWVGGVLAGVVRTGVEGLACTCTLGRTGLAGVCCEAARGFVGRWAE